jgi:ACS family hexuronate transporter-like MFS transporter
MNRPLPDISLSYPRPAWKWWVCGLLLLATMINYMDRLTLNLMAKPIMAAFGLSDREYGQLESAFGSAFALGAIVVGWLVDRWNVRWVYPASVLLWSLAGFATGLVPESMFVALLGCRFLLGLAEAGNWPCALRTTQRILPPSERTMGNGILQSGAAFGAVLTPLIVLALLRLTGSWRYPFLVVGGLGLLWVVLWLVSVRSADLELTERRIAPSLMSIVGWLVFLLVADLIVHLQAPTPWAPLASKYAITVLGIAGVFSWLLRATADDPALPRGVFIRRFWVLAVVVVAINGTWHFFRAWLPLFLQNQHKYGLEDTSWFFLGYYISTDVGSLLSGAAALMLARHGLPVHGSRLVVFAGFGALTLLSVLAAWMPSGPLLLATLLVVGFGALGVFPVYYSLSQELTQRHQGKLTGALGCTCWLAMSLLHEVVGDAVARQGSYSQGVAAAGFGPLVALIALVCFWGRSPAAKTELGAVPDAPDRSPVPAAQSEAIQAPDQGIANGHAPRDARTDITAP